MPKDFPDPGSRLPHPDPVVANGRVVPRRKSEPLRVLNPYSRVLACASATVGAVASLAYLDWRYVTMGLVVTLGVTLAGPWVKPS